MTNKLRETLEKRVRNAILQEAIFRWESAVIISLSVVAAAFGPNYLAMVPGWAWLLGGAVAEAAIVYSSLTDPEFGRKVVADLLQREFRPERLRNKHLQKQVEQALDYRSRIEKGIRERSDILLKEELVKTAGQIDEWLENIYDLARRIDRYEQEKQVLDRDRNQAQSRYAQLQKEMAAEDDERVRRQIEISIESTRRQLATLNTLENTIQRARLQLENSLTHLGTIYSQTMLVDAKDIDSGRARRLRQEIVEEVTELQDLLGAMDEVYLAEGVV